MTGSCQGTGTDAPAVDASLPSVIVIGEILWDVFESSERLGGAPLNFAAHARSYGHAVQLISGLGDDVRGQLAGQQIDELGLDTALLRRVADGPTGTAQVQLDAAGSARFMIPRPVAYDTVQLTDAERDCLVAAKPGWVYFGTLWASLPQCRAELDALLQALTTARKFYDLNLRPGGDKPELVIELLGRSDVVKLNDEELARVTQFADLPSGIEAFCRAGAARFGWQAVTVTRGERGCALLVGDDYVEAAGVPVTVADTVGAGDAFAAALVHGLSRNWPAAAIAAFANRAGAAIASQAGSLPAIRRRTV